MSALPTVAIFRILLVSKNCRFFKRDVSKLSIFLLRCASCLTKRVFRCAWEIMGDAWECLRDLHRGPQMEGDSYGGSCEIDLWVIEFSRIWKIFGNSWDMMFSANF